MIHPIALLLAYAAIVGAVTWPLAAHATTHVPQGGQDDPLVAWALAEESYAVVEAPSRLRLDVSPRSASPTLVAKFACP